MNTAERLTVVMAEIRARGSAENRAGMSRYGINTTDACGVSVYELRRLSKSLGVDHELALALWDTGSHEARLLASMVDDPGMVTPRQMDAWAAAFDSWDVCDQVTSNLFDKTPWAYDKVHEWSSAEDEWVKRAAFATAAALAVQDKAASDERFLEILGDRAARGGRRAQLREEGRQLGAAQCRQAEPAAACGRDRDGRGHPGLGRGPRGRRPQGPGRAQRPLGRPRRVARVALREGTAPSGALTDGPPAVRPSAVSGRVGRFVRLPE